MLHISFERISSSLDLSLLPSFLLLLVPSYLSPYLFSLMVGFISFSQLFVMIYGYYVYVLAGQDRFRTLTSAYYRGAHGIILVYDVNDRKSFENILQWKNEADLDSTNDDAVKMLVGNKIDKDADERKVSKEDGLAFAREHNMLFIEASAKTEEGIQQAFEEVSQKIIEIPSLTQSENDERGCDLDLNDEQPQAGYCC